MNSFTHHGHRNSTGVIAIAMAYVYFLLYAQFGFVSYLKQYFADPIYTERSMGAMGLGGIIFSIMAAVLLRTQSPRHLLAVSFAGCALAAAMTLISAQPTIFYIAALLIGGFAGMLTVTLASSLRLWIAGNHFGLHVGIGTGLAYFICNIPMLFDATPTFQTLFAIVICAIGLACTLRPLETIETTDLWQPVLATSEFKNLGFASIIAMFFALVWLDSTVFATIQLTDDLRAHTWGTPAMKMILGVFHAIAAIAAGFMMDRGHFRSLLVTTFGLFAIAFTFLTSQQAVSWLAGPIYAFGISIYSTALVAYPSLHAEKEGLIPLRWRAAILYAVAGWMGSGLGVGLAQHLHTIPGALIFAAGLVIGIGSCFSPSAASWRRHYLSLLGVGCVGVVYYGQLHFENPPRNNEISVSYGREIYKREGCINCHSQFLRPASSDILRWGPYRSIDRNERPPMVGNRRQGPDLMNAGLRRSEAWHRQHLLDPTSLSPGSKMPSYAHLFRDGDPSGPSLVMYLASLGKSNVNDRLEMIQHWTPDITPGEASPQRGKILFQRYCAMCHGYEGKADGPLAQLFDRPAMKLTKGAFIYAPNTPTGSDPTVALARIVKFGLTGLEMPGHEYFPDRDILDVVAYVQQIASNVPDVDL